SDQTAIEDTRGARAWIVDLALGGATGGNRDLLEACAILGRLLGAREASPSLAAITVDGALAALNGAGEATPSGSAIARAALAEGFQAAVLDRWQARAASAWEYPACSVRIDEQVAALAAGYPSDDGEAIAAWSARVAAGCVRDGLRTAVVAGPEHARAALI